MAKKPWEKHATHWRSSTQWLRTSASALEWVAVGCKSMGYVGARICDRLTFDVRGGRSRRRREPKAQIWDVPLDGMVRHINSSFGRKTSTQLSIHMAPNINKAGRHFCILLCMCI